MLDRVSNRATVKLKEVHALHLEELLAYISFMETTDETIADDPLKWDTSDFRQWRRDDRPSNTTIQPGANATATTNTTTTVTQDN